MSKREKFNDNFEALLLREDHLKNVNDFNNIDTSILNKHRKLIRYLAYRTHKIYLPLFIDIGLDVDDIVAIANVYCLIFYNCSTFSRETRENDKCSHEDQLSKLMVHFIKQKLGHLATVCQRKCRNVLGKTQRRINLAKTADSKQVENAMVLFDMYKKFQYRKATLEEVSQAKFRGADEFGVIRDENGFEIIQLVEQHTCLTNDEYYDVLSGFGSDISKLDPENICLSKESEKELEGYKHYYNNLSNKSKKIVLTKFISSNKGKPYLQAIVKYAKKELKNLKDMV